MNIFLGCSGSDDDVSYMFMYLLWILLISYAKKNRNEKIAWLRNILVQQRATCYKIHRKKRNNLRKNFIFIKKMFISLLREMFRAFMSVDFSSRCSPTINFLPTHSPIDVLSRTKSQRKIKSNCIAWLNENFSHVIHHRRAQQANWNRE